MGEYEQDSSHAVRRRFASSLRESYHLNDGIHSLGHGSNGDVELAATIEADPVGAPFDGENAANVPVPAYKNKLEDGGD